MSEQRKPFGHGKAQPSAPIPSVKKASPPEPAFEVVEDALDFEVVEDAPKPRKGKLAEPLQAPKNKATRSQGPDGGADDAPVKKKKRRNANWTTCPSRCSGSRTRTTPAAPPP